MAKVNLRHVTFHSAKAMLMASLITQLMWFQKTVCKVNLVTEHFDLRFG